ncbi:hypothetical protein [Kribbella flavida]|uniref:hypothetical protein n=1 Tax=Kribbella flavida TaxID=182640 RepID=UPI001ED8DA01|nr:hypothetical protein [Kribbella flavida]
MEHFIELGIVLLAALWALMFWAQPPGPARPMAIALAGGLGAVLLYGLSEWSKTYLDAERPCRTFADPTITADECPPTGDWSSRATTARSPTHWSSSAAQSYLPQPAGIDPDPRTSTCSVGTRR